MSRSSPYAIAIVSAAARLPAAATLEQFWALVREGVDASRDVPPGRWPLDPHAVLQPGGPHPDRVVSLRGYFLEPQPFDPRGLDLDPAFLERLDPVVPLLLAVGRHAWHQAERAAVDPRRVGTVLGNIVLPTEAISKLSEELLEGPFRGEAPGWPRTDPANRQAIGLPAALLARALGLGGGSLTLDAACASSLYALKIACDELAAGRADAMLAGGLNRSDSLYTQMGFSQLRALSPSGRCAPLDARADGLLVGEGAVVFVLKRLTDARAQGDRVLGVIRGIGLSNDRHGGLLAPAREGQLRAMRAAYAQAGWEPGDIEYVECHATGTPVGDGVELGSLRALWEGQAATPAGCVLGAVKANVGHLLTGAGAVSLLKLVLAFAHRTFPPIANFQSAAAAAALDQGPFRIPARAEPWPARAPGQPRRAAINAFGFGGINAHVLVEEEGGEAPVATASDPIRPEIAIVGWGARFGPWTERAALERRLLGGAPEDAPRPASDRGRPGYYLGDLDCPIELFRIPPAELRETLPQQLLLLRVMAEAVEQAGGVIDPERTGAVIGLTLDPNTTNYHFRWLQPAEWRERAGPALTANRVMGHLGSIAASRVARVFGLGGPSFTVSSEETTGLRALALGVRMLERGELDQVLAGSIDLAGDPRCVALLPPERIPGEGAAALVLMRAADAERLGRPILARLAVDDAAGEPFDASPWIGDAGVAGSLASVVQACLALQRRVRPAADGPIPWLHDHTAGPRQAIVRAVNADGAPLAVRLVEDLAAVPARTTAFEPPPDRLFLLEGDTPEDLLRQLETLVPDAPAPVLADWAALWRARHPLDPVRRLGLGLVVRTHAELAAARDLVRAHLRATPEDPLPSPALPREWRDRIAYAPRPLGPTGDLAFVYPGSGNLAPGLGRQLVLAWPDLLRQLDQDTASLRDQFPPEIFWEQSQPLDPRSAMLGQVFYGRLMTALLARFGIAPRAALGISLGESAALVALGAWTDHAALLERMRDSSLFATELAGPCRAARRVWEIPDDAPFAWVSGVVTASAARVREGLPRHPRVVLQIILGERSCVIGGERDAVARFVSELKARFRPLEPVTIAHCAIVEQVAEEYLEFHRFAATPPEGVRFYSGAWGEAYVPETESAARAILGHASTTLDLPRLFRRAHDDGARIFVEIGPGASSSRMIDEALATRPHLARSAWGPEADEIPALLRLLAQLHAQRVPLNLAPLDALEPTPRHAEPSRPGASVTVPVGRWPFAVPVSAAPSGAARQVPHPVPPMSPAPEPHPTPAPALPRQPMPAAIPAPIPASAATPHAVAWSSGPEFQALVDLRIAAARAQETFLRFAQTTSEQVQTLIARQTEWLTARLASATPDSGPLSNVGDPAPVAPNPTAPSPIAAVPVSTSPPPVLDRAQCLEFAVGRIGPVLGERFAAIDAFPTRVRLPAEPLMLVDRITAIEAEPLSMTHGRLVTEHDVHGQRWYLDNQRIPASIAIESGQADLFLSAYLGIDFETRGLATYRLLDAAVTFHRPLPRPGETIRYEIHIDHFFRQGSTYLFRFRFEGFVGNEPLLTMRDGCAGFFSAEELAAGKGVVFTERDLQPQPGVVPAGWSPPAAMPAIESYAEAQLDALRQGDLAAAFGGPFASLPIADPLTLPRAEPLRLTHRVTRLDPRGGRFGLGLIRTETDIHPDDWFLVCHFIDDQVMPGTLMYEGCLHSLRIFLLRMGWIGSAARCVFEPMPGVASRLKCRGQVTASTRTVAYEITIKELGYRPEPYAIADALMLADGKPIVDVRSMTLRLSGTSEEEIAALWAARAPTPAAATAAAPAPASLVATREQILAFATGRPSEAFGSRYRPFDAERFIARLPAPPYSFLDRVVTTTAEPWTLKAGGQARVEYDVPPDAWYFQAARRPVMPYAVVLEAALQSCGWMSAYVGSALHSDIDLHYRNLGGTAVALAEVGPDAGTLATTATLTRCARSAGMIIQHFDFETRLASGAPVYRGTTYFGFFAAQALAQQVGLREAEPYRPTDAERARARAFPYPADAPFPDERLRMLDAIDAYVPDGGPAGLGWIEGSKRVRPGEWFFEAHFRNDPVWPGSLGLEAFLQLLEVAAAERWGAASGARVQSPSLGVEHTWIYRGQVVPENQRVTVQAWITKIIPDTRTLVADGYLSVDGRVIYEMRDFALSQVS